MRTLRNLKKPTVLVLLGWNTPVAIRAIGRYARQANWHVESRPIYTEEIPIGWKGDGLIISDSPRAEMHRFLRRQVTRQPTVIYGSNNLGLPAPAVSEDNVAAGRLAARHFLERNHRHFAWVNAYCGRTATERRDGFIRELHAAGATCALLEFPSASPSASGWKQRRQWLAQHLRQLKRPLALFALDDQLASDAITVCIEQGWRVPEEISVVGVGNLEFACECSLVPLTSIDLGEEDVAWRTAEVLDDLMHNKPAPGSILLPPRGIIIRQSSDTLAVGHAGVQRALRFMKDNLERPIGTEHIAEAAGLSRQALYQFFREELDCTPADQLLHFRLEQARRQLRESKDSAEKIALACGFGTRRTFDRCFMRTHNMPASAWRQQEKTAYPRLTGFTG